LLALVTAMVETQCAAQAITRSDYRFSRRDVREHAGWSDFQVKMHMHKLEELEYVRPGVAVRERDRFGKWSESINR
jgi:DNA primase